METTRIGRLGGLVLGGWLLMGPARLALADEPATADEAAARAQAAQEQADQYRQLGAVAYKTGLVQRAEAEANRYCDKVEELAASPSVVTVTSPDAEHYAQLADDYKQMGAVGYKTGLVQRAEADQRRAEEEATATAQGPSQAGNPEGSAPSLTQYSTETPAACRK